MTSMTEEFFHAFDSSSGIIHITGPDLLVGDVEVEMASEILIEEEVQQQSPSNIAYIEHCIARDHDYCLIPIPEPVVIQEVITENKEDLQEIVTFSEDAILPCSNDAKHMQVSENSEVMSPVRRSQRQIEKLEREKVERIKAENAETVKRETEEALQLQKQLTENSDTEKEYITTAEDEKGALLSATKEEDFVESVNNSENKNPCGHAVVADETSDDGMVEQKDVVDVKVDRSLADAKVPNVGLADATSSSTVPFASLMSVGVSEASLPTMVNRCHDVSMKNITLAELKDAAFLAAPPQQIFACDGDSADAMGDDLPDQLYSGVLENSLSSVAKDEVLSPVPNIGETVKCLEQGPDSPYGDLESREEGDFIESSEMSKHSSASSLQQTTSSIGRLEPTFSKEFLTDRALHPTSTPARKSYPKRENRKPPGRLMDMFEPALFSKPDRMKKIEARWDDDYSKPKYSPSKLPLAGSKTVDANEDDEMNRERDKKLDDIEEYLASVETFSQDVHKNSTVQSVDGGELLSVSSEASDHSKEKLIKKSVPSIKTRKKKRGTLTLGFKKSTKRKSIKKGTKGADDRNSSSSKSDADDGSSVSDESGDSSDWCSEDDPDRLWCICKQPHNDRFMIRCDGCEDWFHGSCVGVTRKQGRVLEKSGKEWVCSKCTKDRVHNKDELQSVEDVTMSKPKPVATLQSNEQLPLTDSEKDKIKSIKADNVLFAAVARDSKMAKKPVKLVRGIPRLPDASPTSKLCIVGCGRSSRADSIYCGSDCIVQHANESLKILGRDKERRIQMKKQDVVKSEMSTTERIVVLERRTGRILTGPNAPTEDNLHEWLKHNPTFEVFRPGKKDIARPSFYSNLHREQPKTIKLISAKPMPVESPAKGSGPKAHQAEATSAVGVTVPEKKITVAEKKVVVDKKPQVQERKPALQERKTSTSEKKTDTKDVKPSAEVKPSAVASASAVASQATPGPEPIRLNVRKSLKEILCARSSDSDDVLLSSDEIKVIAVSIEEELFKCFNDTGAKYKAKYRSLTFNIKDSRNHGLFRKILRGKISPHKLVRMTPEELASKELAMWRERETKHTLEMIKREQEEQQQHTPIIKKTHKGEIEIDESDVGFADKSKTKTAPTAIDANIEVSNMLVDTTEAHRSHLFDLNCKICTGKMLPPAETDVQPKGVRVAKSISIESKSQTEDEESAVESTPGPESLEMQLSSESIGAKEESKKRSSIKRKSERSSSGVAKKQKEQSKEKKRTRFKNEKLKVKKKVTVVKTTVKNKDCEKTSDGEPTSTVTIGSPDCGVPTQSDTDTKTVPSVWKGFIVMQDVSKFVTNAHKVSGPTDFLAQDIPDTIQVCGRIKPNMVWDYLSKMKQSASKEFLVIRFSPANDEEKVAYVSFYSYLSSRNRFGVVANSSKMIKDFYILPLASDSSVPATLLPFDGPGLDETRPHMLLGVIIRHRGKRKVGDKGELLKSAKKKKQSAGSEATEQVDNDAVSKGTSLSSSKKVKFNMSISTDEGYEPSYTPPLINRKSGETTPSEGSFTPPLPTPTSADDSPYDPVDDDDDDDNKPYDPEEAEAAVKVSNSIIPGLLKGSVSSQSVSELIEQISLSSNPTGITSTVLASIATATNLEQQRKLLIELTQKVEEQKRQLEKQKQQIATKVTQQVMGAMNPYSLTPSVSMASVAGMPISMGLGGAPSAFITGITNTAEKKANDDEEAYSPSYTPPPPPSKTMAESSSQASVGTLKLPDTSSISLPPNLQEILESIKKKGAMTDKMTSNDVSSENPNSNLECTADSSSTRSQPVTSVLEDPIVRNFSTVTDFDVDEDIDSTNEKRSSTEVPLKATEEEEKSKMVEDVSVPKLAQSDPRLKGKAQPSDPRVKLVLQDNQKKSELSALSDKELMEKAMKQFEETIPMATCVTVGLGMESVPSRMEPPPPGIEESERSGSEVPQPHPTLGTGNVMMPFQLPQNPYPPTNPTGSAESSGYGTPMYAPVVPPAVFPAYRSTFPIVPPAATGGGYWTERPDWRGRPRFRGRGRGRWHDNSHSDWNPRATASGDWHPHDRDDRKDWHVNDRSEWGRDRRGDKDDWDRDRHGERSDSDRERRGDRDDYDKDRRSDRDDRHRDRDRRDRRDRHSGSRERDRDRDRDKDREKDRSSSTRSRHRE